MDFRIAPFVFSFAHIMLMVWANPHVNNYSPLTTLANRPQWIGIYIVLYALSLGAYFRHTYYSKKEKGVYWFMQAISTILLISYWLSIEAEHLG